MDRPRTSSKSVPDWVGHQYYRLGLLCASHPRPVLFFAVMVVVYSCWPLLSIPVYIGRPSVYIESVQSKDFSLFNSENQSEETAPLWYQPNIGNNMGNIVFFMCKFMALRNILRVHTF